MYLSGVCATLDIDDVAIAADAARMNLTDLLVAIAVFGFVSAAVFTVFDEGLRFYTVSASRAESQQSARVAVERLAGEIRTAGFGPGSATFPAISVAEPAHIVVHQDLDGDGLVTGAGETVIWRLTGTTLRRDAGGGAQPVIDGVRRFALEYLDAFERSVRVPDEIRSVVITIATDAAWEPADRASVTVFTTRVRLRNR
jgi:type II secretory pathway component PulJ